MKKWVRDTAIKILSEKNVDRIKQIRDRKIVKTIPYDEKYHKEWEYINKIGFIKNLPYDWTDEYNYPRIIPQPDGNGCYITVNGEARLYLPSEYGDTYGKRVLRGYIMEQDLRSPHYYFSKNVAVDEGTVFFDCGAADAMITLLNIDKIKKAYIIEPSRAWGNALSKTFAQYKDKIEVIPKLVGDRTDRKETDLTDFIRRHKSDNILIKMDIGGAEVRTVRKILQSINSREYKMKFTVCTYHNNDDYEELYNIFSDAGYLTESSDGYMLFGNPPSFRRGIMRAWIDENEV